MSAKAAVSVLPRLASRRHGLNSGSCCSAGARRRRHVLAKQFGLPCSPPKLKSCEVAKQREGTMSGHSDTEFEKMLQAPAAYQKARNRAGATAIGSWVQTDAVGALGVLRSAGRAANRVRRASLKAAGTAAHANALTLSAHAARYAGRGLALASAPLRKRIFRAFFRKLAQRRARLLSWRSRGSLRPNSAEQQAARRWTVGYVKRRGLLGRLVGTALAGDSVGEPATSALVTASIPFLLELARRALKAAESHGAPADPRAEAPYSTPSAPEQTE